MCAASADDVVIGALRVEWSQEVVLRLANGSTQSQVDD
jgi:hypothetical protein